MFAGERTFVDALFRPREVDFYRVACNIRAASSTVARYGTHHAIEGATRAIVALARRTSASRSQVRQFS